MAGVVPDANAVAAAAAAAVATGGSTASAAAASSTLLEQHELSAEGELRLEVPSHFQCCLLLSKGSAEIFGTELASQKPYEIQGPAKFAVFTWHGATVEIHSSVLLGSGAATTPTTTTPSDMIVYTSDETSANVAYVNTHAQLEALRDEAVKGNSSGTTGGVDGPRVLLVGPADCGKSSLARTLISYAVKIGRHPLLIDLDVSQSMLSIPGTLSAAVCSMSNRWTVETHIHSGFVGAASPLVFWYGSTSLQTNPELYKALVTRLGECVNARFSQPPRGGGPGGGGGDATDGGRSTGFIVNTGGWIEDVGYQLLLHTAEALRINVILIVGGHDRLYSMLQSHFTKSAAAATANPPKIIKLPRSGGVVARDAAHRRKSQSLSVRRYFHGDEYAAPSFRLTPCRLQVEWSALRCFKLSSVSLSASLLPVSAKQSTDPVQLELLTELTASLLLHKLLAVCHPTAVDTFDQTQQASDLYLGGVAGFVAVEQVNVAEERISFLSPCSGSLPSHTLLVGATDSTDAISWME